MGRAVCASCHAEQERLWLGSHHDLAMQEADPATVLGDFEGVSFEHFGSSSTFFRRDGGFAVRTEGPDGQPADFDVAYTFGVEPLQQYLIPLPGGRLQALGVAWDARPESEGGGRWYHLYPGEAIPAGDELHWTAPLQNWNSNCAECHSTNLERRYDATADRYQTSWSELDVSCEACHGPGSAHVAWAEDAGKGVPPPNRGLVFDIGADNDAEWRFEPGADIATRSAPRRSHAELEACARCHSRRSVLRERLAHGRPLLDGHRPALLEAGLYHPDGQILEEVYVWGSFLQSRMYAAGVTCSDCHDPHGLAIAGDPDAACARCHRPERFAARDHHFHPPESDGARCVACHMPEQVYMGVDARRDHSLRIPRPDLSESLGTPNACTGCHAERPASWAVGVIEGASDREPGPHFGEVLEAGRRRAPRAARRLARLADDRGQPAIVRASALRLLRDRPDPAVVGTLESAAGDPEPLVRLGAAEASEWLEPRARVRTLRRLLRDPMLAVRIQAARALAAVPGELLAPGDRAALAQGLGEYRAAQRANAERPEARLNLGALYTEQGQLGKARAEYEAALRLEPRFVPARVNLADLERLAGRDEDGERALRQGLELTPESPDLHHALGLLLARAERRDEALQVLARAAELAPDRSRFAYVYGLALLDAEQGDRAIEVLRSAQQQHPGDRALLFSLATIERDRGNRAEALRWTRKLQEITPEDPAVSALLEQLGAAGN